MEGLEDYPQVSYADKRKSTAQCKVRDCEDSGTKLEIREGVLNWYCERHTTNVRDGKD